MTIPSSQFGQHCCSGNDQPIWTNVRRTNAGTTGFIRNRGPLKGFSLMELIVVMVILVIVASLAMPTVHRSFSRQSLTTAAGMVRTSMGRARVRSIKTGKIQAVYYLPGKSWHGVAPFENVQEQMSIANRRSNDAEEQLPFEILSNDLLPRGIVFAEGEAIVDARAAQAAQDNGQKTSGVKVILFYPDGTSQDAQVILENDRGALMKVNLRGLTGTATTSDVEARE